MNDGYGDILGEKGVREEEKQKKDVRIDNVLEKGGFLWEGEAVKNFSRDE